MPAKAPRMPPTISFQGAARQLGQIRVGQFLTGNNTPPKFSYKIRTSKLDPSVLYVNCIIYPLNRIPLAQIEVIMPNHSILPLLSLMAFLLTACSPLAVIPAREIETEKITLGSVQSRVIAGVGGGEVIAALGSPNIVTSNTDGTETWVYDKVMTEQEEARGAYRIFAGGRVSVKSSRTMIVTVRFDTAKRVSDVKYRQMSY